MKKQKRLVAMLMVFCMSMSLLSVSAFAENAETEQDPLFGCGYSYEHQHTDSDGAACEMTKLVCLKHVHDETECYTEGELTCLEEAAQDLICELPQHTHNAEDNCWHKHSTACYAPICGLEEGEWACTAEGEEHECNEGCYHKHVSSCYASEPSCIYAEYLEAECDDNLECLITPHTHIKIAEAAEEETPCYEYHTHTVEKNCYVCSIEPHTHIRECLTPDALEDVLAVEALLDAAPSLTTMHAERANMDAGAYETYITDSNKARNAAQAAYDLLPAALKKLVNSDLVAKLAPLDTVFNEYKYAKEANGYIDAEVTEGHDAYMFQSVYAPGYEMSNHVFTAPEKNNQIPELLMLVNADSNYTWNPNGLYPDGRNPDDPDAPLVGSNYEVLYCSDIETGYHPGIHYKRTNLEESGYYGDKAAQHIRNIVTNSYPYISLENMKANLIAANVGGAEKLTRGDIIAAVQFAIWRYANGAGVEDYSYTRTFDLNHVPESWSYSVHNYANEMYNWWNVGKVNSAGKNVTAYWTDIAAGERIANVVEYLTSLEGETAPKEQVIITRVEVIDEPVLVNGGLYEVALLVKLNSSGSGARDNLTLTATAGSSNETSVDVVYGQKNYVMLVTAAPNDEIVVELSGTQCVPEGAYFYAPEKTDDTIARDVSQNLVGVAWGDTPVYAAASLTFEMEVPEIPVSASLNLLKVDQNSMPLANVPFALATDVDNNGTPDAFKTYITGEDGKAVIEGLMPGKEYVLTEVEAPSGYYPLGGEIRFTVEQAEDLSLNMVFQLPSGVNRTLEDGQYGLTVVNYNIPVDDGDGDDFTIIPDGPVPMNPTPNPGETPKEEPVVTPDEELVEIPEEDVPLADVPKTGDTFSLWMAASTLLSAGMAGVAFAGCKKREED